MGGSQAARPAKVLYIDPPSPNLPRQMIEDEDEEDEDQPGEMGMDWEGGESDLFPRYEEGGQDFLLDGGRGPGGDLLTQALTLTDLPTPGGRKKIPFRPVTLPFTHRHAVQTIVKAQTECLSSFYQDLPGLRARFRGIVD